MSEFFLNEKNASKTRLKEAENARKNRAEFVSAYSQGRISRRDLVKLGLITSAGLIVPKNGLSPFAFERVTVLHPQEPLHRHYLAPQRFPSRCPASIFWSASRFPA